MNKDNSKIIISSGIIIFLILITWTVMGWPLNITDITFWIFIFVSFFEAILVVVVNEILKSKLKKKKRIIKKFKKLIMSY